MLGTELSSPGRAILLTAELSLQIKNSCLRFETSFCITQAALEVSILLPQPTARDSIGGVRNQLIDGYVILEWERLPAIP